jgi:hypothetical protein
MRNLIKMSETQTAIQKIEEKTRKKLDKTRENLKNVFDKMRNNKLGLEETDPSQEEP